MQLTVDGDRETGATVLIAILDNLGKGASGAAVQNLNIMLGLRRGDGALVRQPDEGEWLGASGRSRPVASKSVSALNGSPDGRRASRRTSRLIGQHAASRVSSAVPSAPLM
jgi:hypothetical protein